MMMMIIIII